MPRLEPKSSQLFLAIKRCQRTKSKKVIKLAQSLLIKVAHICANRGIPVNIKLIYFYCLSVNYNNRSPTIGNDSQNSIDCCRRAAKIYELTNNIVMNNNIAWLYFLWTITWSMVMQDIKLTKEKNGPASLAISMAMRIRWYGAERITHGTSRATRDANGLCHRARTPWSSILA